MKSEVDEFQIKRLVKKDVLIFKNLLQLFEEVFEMKNPSKVKQSYLEALLEKPEFISYVVLCKNEVVAGLTAYELPMYYSEYSEMFIYDIAVRKDFQRKGLGKKLLQGLAEYCREHSIKIMFVEAHEEDKDAVDFYHSTGGQAEKVVHFNYDLFKRESDK